MPNTATKPILQLTQKAWTKIWALTYAAKTEVSCLGIMAKTNPNMVLDVFVPEQRCSTGVTIMDEDSVAEMTLALAAKGVDMEQISFWQHSHADGAVFWSATDDNNIDRFESDKVMWSLVTNRKDKFKIRADIWKPFRYTFDDCDYDVIYPEVEGIKDWTDSAMAGVHKIVQTPKRGYKFNNATNVIPRGAIIPSASETLAIGGESIKKREADGKYPDNMLGNAWKFGMPALYDALDEKLISHPEAIKWDLELKAGTRTEKQIEDDLLTRMVMQHYRDRSADTPYLTPSDDLTDLGYSRIPSDPSSEEYSSLQDFYEATYGKDTDTI